MAHQPTTAHSHGQTDAPRAVPRLSERESLRRRAAARARSTGDVLLAWSIPLIVTALVFAVVVGWFWWSS